MIPTERKRKEQERGGVNEHGVAGSVASRFKFIMNSLRAPNFNTERLAPLRH